MSSEGDRGALRPDDFRLLVEQAADGIFIANEDGRFIHVNAAGHRLLGYEPGELSGKTLMELIPAYDRPLAPASFAAVVHGQVVTRERTFVHKDGGMVRVELRAQRLRGGLVAAIVRDLASRPSIEAQVRASEAQLRSILETAPDFIFSVDRDGKILFANRLLPQHKMEEVVGSSSYDYVPPEARPRVAAALERVFERRELDQYEIEGPLLPSGERMISSVRAGPLIEGDRVVAATLCASDVTRQRHEEARAREVASRLHKIASLVPGVVFQYRLRPDGTSCFPYASERIRDIYRVSPEQVREDASQVFALGHPDDYAGVVESITTSARTMQPWQHEYRIRFPDGEVRWLYGNAVPEREPDGAVLWHGFITDVSRRKEAEEAKAQLEDRLRQSQKVESLGRLAGGVAHDFNNLLTSLMGFVELALSGLPVDSPTAEYLQGALEGASRGAALTQQLLAFARKKIVRPEIVYLNDVIERVTPMLRRLLGETLELTLTLAPDLAMVEVDMGSIEQVVVNLVLNARDAIAGSGRISIETLNTTLDEEYFRTHGEGAPGGYVMLGVSDTGSGMTPEIRAHAFEPFFTTKAMGEGTGLGLATCQGIVRQAGGSISVYSEPGMGSTFRVYLPRIEAARRPAHPPPPAVAASARGHETVLLVEDEPAILRVAADALGALGYRVITAPDGPRALQLVHGTTQPIHLLITDVVMPKMGGPELARRVEELRPGVRVLYSSGYTENAIVDHGVLQPGIHFLQKPYSTSTLAIRVRQVLDS